MAICRMCGASDVNRSIRVLMSDCIVTAAGTLLLLLSSLLTPSTHAYVCVEEWGVNKDDSRSNNGLGLSRLVLGCVCVCIYTYF
jgi:hypothetical protein